MADIEITIDGGTQKRLLTAGKYCDRDILLTATGSGTGPVEPDDGKTRLYIDVQQNAEIGFPPPRSRVALHIQQTVENGVSVDWGDGSEIEIIPGSGDVSIEHTYGEDGSFVVALDPVDGCELVLGHDRNGYCVMGPTGNSSLANLSMLSRVVLGRGNRKIGAYAFYGCRSLSSIVFGTDITSIGRYAFHSCVSLESVKIPDNVTDIGDLAFAFCTGLRSANIPDSVTDIGSYAFSRCSIAKVVIPKNLAVVSDYAFDDAFCLTSVVIPGNVTSIESSSFSRCYGVKEYHIKASTPPVMQNKNAFDGIVEDCIIYVPAGSVEEYKRATNWSVYADKIQAEPS